MKSNLSKLETELETIRQEKDTFVFPCPNCHENMGKSSWSVEAGGECKHCYVSVTPDEMEEFIIKSHELCQQFFSKHQEVSDARTRAYVLDTGANGLPAWRKFVENGYRFVDFSEKLYHMLNRTFGHIAQYNSHGFYMYHFGTMKATVRTLEKMIEYKRVLTSPWSELEKEIIGEIIDGDDEKDTYMGMLKKKLHTETEKREREQLAKLKAKYET